jgi:hypothetical protein
MSNPKSFTTPVLLCVFNRPELTSQVVEAMRRVKPSRIYVSADGPRSEVISDSNKIREVREVINTIDWPCELHLRFLEENLGCGMAISSAIDWLFEHETEGIILEDDTVPTSAFFPFCSAMLELYREEDNVFMISGTNFFPDVVCDASHFLTRLPAAWGWATWRRSWMNYDYEVNEWKNIEIRRNLLLQIDNPTTRLYAEICLDDVINSKVNTWDYQWQLLGLFSGFFGVTSGENLVTNIGVEGTHSNKRSRSHHLPTSMKFKVPDLTDLSKVDEPNDRYDRRFIQKRVLPIVVKRKLRVIINQIILKFKLKL